MFIIKKINLKLTNNFTKHAFTKIVLIKIRFKKSRKKKFIFCDFFKQIRYNFKHILNKKSRCKYRKKQSNTFI